MTRRRAYPTSQARVRAAPSLFVLLDEAAKKASVLKLASAGMGDFGISQMTGMDVQTVRRLLAERDIAERTK